LIKLKVSPFITTWHDPYVKMLVEAYPQSLLVTDETWPLYPIHAAAYGLNPNDLHEVIEYFLELESTSLRFIDGDGNTPLHLACESRRVNISIVQLLHNSWPEAIRLAGHKRYLPIHELCCNQMLEESNALAVLRFMLDTDQTIVRERDTHGYLPIHHAVDRMPNEFCKVLIDAYPESVRVRTNNDGSLPIHIACGHHYGNSEANVETIQYLLELYPESVNATTLFGQLPIHNAALGERTDIIELLLKYDPDAATKKTTQSLNLPLHVTCGESLKKQLDVAEVLFDSYPQAINAHNCEEKTPYLSKIVNFLLAQQGYDQKAKDTKVMHTPDENGWLPLHHALKDNTPLGSIKLLLKGNPLALRVITNIGALPIHIACEFSPVRVVKYLVEELDVNERLLEHCDINKDSILHYACRGVNCEVVKYLLGEYTSLASSAEVNGEGELPLHLLCEAGKDNVVNSDNSTEYTETVWLMLLANPEVIMS